MELVAASAACLAARSGAVRFIVVALRAELRSAWTGRNARPHTKKPKAKLVPPIFLAEVVDYEDHAGAEGGYVAVVVFQGGDGGVVGSGDGVESFSGFDAVVNDAGSRARGRGGFGAGGRLQSGVVFGV